jgi:glycogenin glucosyltransferase
MKKYVTCLSTDSYLPGVLILNMSLIDSGCKYPLLALVMDGLEDSTYKALEKAGIEYIIKKPEFKIDQSVLDANIRARAHRERNLGRWNHTFFKVYILDVPCEKIVFLDADVMVMQNIDDLFDRPHFSACWDEDINPPNEGLSGFFASGLMVICPNKDELEKAIQLTNRFKGSNGGDQTIFNRLFPDWKDHPELKLPREYAVLGSSRLVSFSFKNTSFESVKVFHMVGKKLWMDIGEPVREIDTLKYRSTTLERHTFNLFLKKYRLYEEAVSQLIKDKSTTPP